MQMLDSSSFREPPIEDLTSHQVTKLIISKQKELDAHVIKEHKKIESLKLIQTEKLLFEKKDIVIKLKKYIDNVSSHIYVAQKKGIVKKIIAFESKSTPIEPSVQYAVVQWNETTGEIKIGISNLKVVEMDTESVARARQHLFYAYPDSAWNSKRVPLDLRESFVGIQNILSDYYVPGMNSDSMKMLDAWMKTYIKSYVEHKVKVKATSKKFGI